MKNLQYLGKENLSYSDEFFFMDLSKETFIHFTSLKRAQNIIKNGRILLNPPIDNRIPGAYAVFAISLTYGSFVPSILNSVDKYAKMDNSEPVALIFKSTTMPKAGFPEEVSFGEKDVDVINPTIVSKEEGISMLKNTPEKIEDGQIVLYDPAIVQSIKFVKPNAEGTPMKKYSSMIDKIANIVESKGLIKEAYELDRVSDYIEKLGGVGLSLMGSGEQIDLNGTTTITARERSAYLRGIGKDVYFNSLSELTDKVVKALNGAGLKAVAFGDDEWTGSLTGALSSGQKDRLEVDLAKDGKKVTNSLLILNIYKMDGSTKVSYELNSYLS